MSIILIRHGETAMNAARIMQMPDTPLSERGRQQARAVANRLANTSVAAIVSSDLPRAMETASAIALSTGAAISQNELLQERNFGDLRGHSYDGLGYNPIIMEAAPPAGESMDAFRRRVAQGFALVCDMHSTTAGDLVVVSHGLFIRILLEQHAVMPQGTSSLPTHVANTSVTIISADAPYQVRIVNNTDHLDAALHDDPRGVSGV